MLAFVDEHFSLTHGLVVSHQESISSHDVTVEGGADGLINRLTKARSNAAKPCLVDRLLVDVVSAHAGYRWSVL